MVVVLSASITKQFPIHKRNELRGILQYPGKDHRTNWYWQERCNFVFDYIVLGGLKMIDATYSSHSSPYYRYRYKR